MRRWSILLLAAFVTATACSSADAEPGTMPATTSTTVAPVTTVPATATTTTTSTTTSTTTTTTTTTTSVPELGGSGRYPVQPDDVAWPTQEWSSGDLPDGVDRAAIDAAVESAFGADDEAASMRSILVVHRGAIVYERYHPLASIDTVFDSFSVAKSVTAALVGFAVDDGLIEIEAPAGLAEWSDDDRSAITVEDLLRMSSGLEWTESYSAGDDPIEMLAAPNAASVPIAKPLVAAPGEQFVYSTGTSAVLTELLARTLGGPDALDRFIDDRLNRPLGIESAALLRDPGGVFVGGIGFDATSRDFARFGLLHLRGGVWDGQRVLSEEWIDAVRTPSASNDGYGLHWWLRDDGGFSALGLFGQQVLVLPHLDLVVVATAAPGSDPFSATSVVIEQFAAVG